MPTTILHGASPHESVISLHVETLVSNGLLPPPNVCHKLTTSLRSGSPSIKNKAMSDNSFSPLTVCVAAGWSASGNFRRSTTPESPSGAVYQRVASAGRRGNTARHASMRLSDPRSYSCPITIWNERRRGNERLSCEKILKRNRRKFDKQAQHENSASKYRYSETTPVYFEIDSRRQKCFNTIPIGTAKCSFKNFASGHLAVTVDITLGAYAQHFGASHLFWRLIAETFCVLCEQENNFIWSTIIELSD